MLLPLPPASVRQMSLQIHLALAACRKDGCGNSHQFNELLRILYITHQLQELGFGQLPLEDYARAEHGLSAALSRVEAERRWLIDAETASLLERVLQLHDQQLATIRLRDLTAATERLQHFMRSERPFPLPEHVRAAIRNRRPSQ
ncbi:hypothetical protein CR51_08680 [Caballeronia megalochromosomata]|nr:hypothetical protein CR51_08680 [Caballeronia megalochromosomata]